MNGETEAKSLVELGFKAICTERRDLVGSPAISSPLSRPRAQTHKRRSIRALKLNRWATKTLRPLEPQLSPTQTSAVLQDHRELRGGRASRRPRPLGNGEGGLEG